MTQNIEGVEIVICLGSSCFARGNSENLAIIQEFVEKHGLKASIRLGGRLCQDQCKQVLTFRLAGRFIMASARRACVVY